MNANLSEYLLPVHADVPATEAILVEEVDPHVNEIGVKGIGEIGIVGAAAAIANAVSTMRPASAFAICRLHQTSS